MGGLPHLRGLRILIVTPDATGPRGGNRVTAQRWARLLRELGHRVRVAGAYTGQRCQVLVALHARRSAPSVARFRRERPRVPLVVALTGTDLYADLRRSAEARRSLEVATRVVLLQPLGRLRLPASARRKARVILQSALPPPGRPRPRRGVFEVCLLAHLRPVKDPLRAAAAARLLPARSRVVVVHAGAGLDSALARRARAEAARNPRYRWVGEQPRGAALRLLARSRLALVTSRLEGGANVVSEAAACGIPLLASRIDGNMGLLGPGYPGLYSTGDTRGLARLLARAERDPVFLGGLKRRMRGLAAQVRPAREKAAWRSLLRGMAGVLSSRPNRAQPPARG